MGMPYLEAPDIKPRRPLVRHRNHHSPFRHSSFTLQTVPRTTTNQGKLALLRAVQTQDLLLHGNHQEGTRSCATHSTRKVSVGEARHATLGTPVTSVANWTMEGLTATSRPPLPLLPPPVTFPDIRPLPSAIINKYVNISRLEHMLAGYPDGPMAQFILDGFRYGFNLGFRGLINEQPLRNNKSARDNPEKVSEAIIKEVQRGHTSGPFISPPFPHSHLSAGC